MKPNHKQLSAPNHPRMASASLATSATNSNHIKIDSSPSAEEVARKVYICHGNQNLQPDDELHRWLVAEAQLLEEGNGTLVYGIPNQWDNPLRKNQFIKASNGSNAGAPLALPISSAYAEGEPTTGHQKSRLNHPVSEKRQLTAQAAVVDVEPVEPRRRKRAFGEGDTAITLYLREIARVKVLTAQAEIDLAARIKKGDKKAREQMIKANLPLVVKIARGFEGNGLPLLDLISEGNIGLMKAVRTFDPDQGNKLAKCGSRWIKHSMSQALANQSKALRSREPSSSS